MKLNLFEFMKKKVYSTISLLSWNFLFHSIEIPNREEAKYKSGEFGCKFSIKFYNFYFTNDVLVLSMNCVKMLNPIRGSYLTLV